MTLPEVTIDRLAAELAEARKERDDAKANHETCWQDLRKVCAERDEARATLALTAEALAASECHRMGLVEAIRTHSESFHSCSLCDNEEPCDSDDVCLALQAHAHPSTALAARDAATRAETLGQAAHWVRECGICDDIELRQIEKGVRALKDEKGTT